MYPRLGTPDLEDKTKKCELKTFGCLEFLEIK